MAAARVPFGKRNPGEHGQRKGQQVSATKLVYFKAKEILKVVIKAAGFPMPTYSVIEDVTQDQVVYVDKAKLDMENIYRANVVILKFKQTAKTPETCAVAVAVGRKKNLVQQTCRGAAIVAMCGHTVGLAKDEKTSIQYAIQSRLLEMVTPTNFGGIPLHPMFNINCEDASESDGIIGWS